ncbi:acetylglutamate kinase [Limnoglobus roseus]|uniref:Acetylglutamate kinase n=1 Tax=Limnoglobus roseus TaxID=2598579 RepID=A0A5C1AHX8_9BACT|nr:acetylglutamate kinase [Limnoglobus roseus]QEL16568.1 acetylglutamate kinase [Limnoglobus roseus]
MNSTAVLLKATARARELRGRVLVVKLGGSAMEDPAATRATLESVVALQTLGVRLVLVHGGGKPIDRAMAASGLTPKKVAGRRYTDAATLDIVVRVLCENINAEIVKGLNEHGGRAEGVADAAAFPISGEKLTLVGDDQLPIDLGFVGSPTVVDAAYLGDLLDAGLIPVIPSLCLREDGGWLNVNADTIASAVAGALRADATIFLTDTPGILRDKNDPNSRIETVSVKDAKQLIADRVIDGGMIPKVEACFEALAAGAKRAVILDGRVPHALLAEFVGEAIVGTQIVP